MLFRSLFRHAYCCGARQRDEKWVDECVSSHATCNNDAKEGQLRYPTRLLQVNGVGDPHIRVIETARTPAMQGPYNVLSYRWGSSQPVMLLEGNLAEFLRGIAVQRLPRTLAEAVEITRKMGIPYLWIDALCIIQDSPEDWASESRTMATVYGNVRCSLAASHNFDSDDGLAPFISGSARGRPISVRFPTLSEGAPYRDFRLVEHAFWDSRVDDAPLNTRG